MSEPTAADLRAAVEVLQRGGWTQGRYFGPNGYGGFCHCVSGAVCAAVSGDPFASPDADVAPHRDWYRRWAEALDALAVVTGTDHESIPDWNDDEDRTAEEVIAALEAAADAAEAQQ